MFDYPVPGVNQFPPPFNITTLHFTPMIYFGRATCRDQKYIYTFNTSADGVEIGGGRLKVDFEYSNNFARIYTPGAAWKLRKTRSVNCNRARRKREKGGPVKSDGIPVRPVQWKIVILYVTKTEQTAAVAAAATTTVDCITRFVGNIYIYIYTNIGVPSTAGRAGIPIEENRDDGANAIKVHIFIYESVVFSVHLAPQHLPFPPSTSLRNGRTVKLRVIFYFFDKLFDFHWDSPRAVCSSPNVLSAEKIDRKIFEKRVPYNRRTFGIGDTF